MMNNKETLIKTLRGSVAQLNELSDMTEGIDVYDLSLIHISEPTRPY